MKGIYLLLLALSFTIISSAQDITLYGFLPSNNPDTEFLRLGSMDALTGSLRDVDSIYPVNAYALGSSTFDAFNSAYMFLGVDTSFAFRLYSRSTRETTLFDPEINQTINDLQFDMNSTATYGIGNYKSDSTLFDSINNLYEYEYAMRFISVDQDSGQIVELERYPDLVAFPAGSSTFDANNGKYIVNAYDTSFVDRLCIIDAQTGSVLSKDPTGTGPGEYLNNLEYNNEDDKIYGLFRGNGSTFQALVSIDVNNQNTMDTIYVFGDLQYFVQGSAVLHQSTQSYIMYYIDTDNKSRLAVIDLQTGTLVANPEISQSLTELEVDNTEYALAKYHETVSTDENPTVRSSIKVFPNPVSTTLFVESGMINSELQLINLSGSTIMHIDKMQAGLTGLAVDHLHPGIYVLLISNGSETESFKVVIR